MFTLSAGGFGWVTIDSGFASQQWVLFQSFGAFKPKSASARRPGQPTLQLRHLLHLPVSSTTRQLSQSPQCKLCLHERQPLPLGRDSCGWRSHVSILQCLHVILNHWSFISRDGALYAIVCQYTNGRIPSGLELVNLGVGMPRTWTLRLQSISWSSFYLLGASSPFTSFSFSLDCKPPLPRFGYIWCSFDLQEFSTRYSQSYKAGHSTWKTRLTSIEAEPSISPRLHIYDLTTKVWCNLLEEIDFHFSWHKKLKKLRTMQHHTITYHNMQWQPLLDEPDDLS